VKHRFNCTPIIYPLATFDVLFNNNSARQPQYTMDNTTNAINWFEIPAKDINRAKTFYEKILSVKLDEWPDMMGMKMVGFPYNPQTGKVGGALVQSEMHNPSIEGPVVFLNGNAGLDNILSRVESAGGQVVMPKTQINPEIGAMAFIIDSEGNKIGFHSDN